MGRCNTRIRNGLGLIACLLSLAATSAWSLPIYAKEGAVPTYSDQVQPILIKYCTGCHNADDREGDFSLETFADLEQGLEKGPAILAGQPDSSRLIRVLSGLAEPKMPPEDNASPSAAEVTTLRAWIEAGAHGPDHSPLDRPRLIVPTIAPQAVARSPAVTALAISPATGQLAIARFSHVEVRDVGKAGPVLNWMEFPGKVNAIHFSTSGDLIVTASGVTGLYGQADIFDVRSGERQISLVGHHDTLYDAEFSPDGKLLATAGYDGRIVLWNLDTAAVVHTIDGHNGAVFDLAFDPAGAVLASASADETVKLWKVETGERLDTLSQPTAEQYVVDFSPDGKFIVAGGADNRIRVWKFVSRSDRRINPLRWTRFAHDGAVVAAQFALGGQVLITAGADRKVRLWETRRYADSRLLVEQPAAIHDLSVNATGDKLAIGGMDGRVDWQGVLPIAAASRSTGNLALGNDGIEDRPIAKEPSKVAEHEPNDSLADAQSLELPVILSGVINTASDGNQEDIDLYKIQLRAGKKWIIEIKASREKSPLDSNIAVLTADGKRIERLVLQAVRDSYFSFRGKDSTQIGDFRLHNWEEMQLNEYLYAGGEVTRLWLYPRGPDSGFNVYPGKGHRTTYFGTSGVAHALNEPAYIVEPYPPGTTLVPTGLPIFPIYYENDDDGSRELGTDSRLEFTAPADGNYLIQVRDVRGFGGESYTYELTVRQPSPSFEATVAFEKGKISPGSGREFSIELARKDGFEGEVTIDIEGLPAGFVATSPVSVEANQIMAFGTIHVLPDTSQPPSGSESQVRVAASAQIAGERVTKNLEWTTPFELGDEPEVYVRILPVMPLQGKDSMPSSPPSATNQLELTVAPGQTISAVAQITRKEGFSGRVSFGQEAAGRNLPHGVYVDNIGLNGLLIVENANEREFSITADTWVPETTRLFHLRTGEQGNQTSWPVILHVQK